MSRSIGKTMGLALLTIAATLPLAGSAYAKNPITWTKLPGAGAKTSEANGVAADGKLFRFGGFDQELDASKDAEYLDAKTGKWVDLPEMPEPLTHSATCADKGTIYLVGGYVGDHPSPATASVWILKSRKGKYRWVRGPSLPAERGGGACAILGRGLHFFGGTNLKRNVDEGTHWVLNLDSGKSWETLAPMPNPRNHLGGAAVGGKIYALGGQYLEKESDTPQAEVDEYDPQTKAWKRVADLPKGVDKDGKPLPKAGRGHINAGTFAMNGHVIVIAGDSFDGKKMRDVSSYNPVTNTWKHVGMVPREIKSVVGGVINGRIYFTTGKVSKGSTSDTFWGSFKHSRL